MYWNIYLLIASNASAYINVFQHIDVFQYIHVFHYINVFQYIDVSGVPAYFSKNPKSSMCRSEK